MRVALLVRVEPVVAAVRSWLAAHSACCDQRAVARGPFDLVPPDPNRDHEHECGDVNQGDKNDQGGQAVRSVQISWTGGKTSIMLTLDTKP